MPNFEFTSPQGQKYTVSGPDGSTQEQAFAILQKQMSFAPPQQQSEGAAQGQRILSDIDQTNKETGMLLPGIGEAALNTATGIGSSVVGGWRALATLATGGSLDDAAKASQDTQQDYTYQPRTGVGKLITEAGSAPLNAVSSGLSSVGGDVGQYFGGDQGRIAGESIGGVAPAIAATLMGGRAALAAVKPVLIAPPAPSVWSPRAAPVDAPYLPDPVLTPSPKAPYGDISYPLMPDDAPATPVVGSSQYDSYNIGLPDAKVPLVPLDLSAHGVETPSLFDVHRMNLEATKNDAIQQAIAASAPLAPIDPGLALPSASAPALSPLESLASGGDGAIPAMPAQAPISSLAASVGNTSDITSILQKFGVQEPESPPIAAPEPAAVAQDAVPSQQPASDPFSAPSTLTTDEQARNMQVLKDIGLQSIRKSAIEGSEANGATDYQLGKYTSEPAGLAAFDQFNAERDAMANYTQQLIDKTGAPSGMDEQSLQAKGQAIAAPYDAARAYFEAAKNNLYNIANQRAEASGVPVGTTAVDALLADPDFKATLMAKDQQGLLNTIQSQYDRFNELDPNGLSVQNAENYRQWLNKVWSPSNSGTLGQVKAALDQDVFSSAGQDVYAAGRQMHQLEKQTLDDPNGISKLMDADPYTPINRTTPYNQIPDRIIGLSPDQFQHIIDTYNGLPDELQPVAQAAINTIKAHYGDKILQAGTQTAYGNPRAIWNSGGINTIIQNNSAKLPMVFTDPADMQIIKNIVDGGNILRVNPAYPGASAQAANAVSRGAMSKIIGKATTGVGALAGAGVGGPIGAGLGGGLGAVIGDSLSNTLGERKALENWKQRIIDQQASPGPVLIDPFEGY